MYLLGKKQVLHSRYNTFWKMYLFTAAIVDVGHKIFQLILGSFEHASRAIYCYRSVTKCTPNP